MNILYLCSKNYFDTKMSRVRFHAMDAISKVSNVIYSGNGWKNYNDSKMVQENIDVIYNKSLPDVVVAYKPLEFRNFKDIKCPKCITYNEMWDKKGTTKEILGSGANLVICHHLNDMPNYTNIKNVKFVNIPHSAEQTIYRDYGLKKDNDVLLVGSLSQHYPFRLRLFSIIKNNLSKVVKCKVLKHPGGDLRSLHGFIGKKYAMEINKSKITLTCSSKYKYRLGKYVEIPMCASLLGADLPNENHDFFNQFMLVLDPKDSDKNIVDKIVYYVKNDDERDKLIQKGIELNKEYTQEKYADRFIKNVEEFLK